MESGAQVTFKEDEVEAADAPTVSVASDNCSKGGSPEEEFGEWTQFVGAPPIGGSSPPLSKEAPDSKTSSSRRALGCLVFFVVSLPTGYLATILGLARYEPTINAWLDRNYLTIYIAFGATLVLFFVHIFPRVKSHPPLNILFTSLFLTALAYLTAVLSVIIDTAAPFMCNSIWFVGCWQLMICCALGVDLNATEGRWCCGLIYLTDFVIVAVLLPSRVSDKIVVFFVVAFVAKVQFEKVNALIEKVLQEQDAV